LGQSTLQQLLYCKQQQQWQGQHLSERISKQGANLWQLLGRKQ
jgi:hypothetical protein